MNNDWATLVRQYLARRDPAALAQAIAAAQEQEVIALLEAFQERDINTVERLATTLHESLQRIGRVEEALTVALFLIDMYVHLVELYNRVPLEQQTQVLRRGLEACETAIRLATLCDDLSCVAFYQVVKGNGLYHACDLHGAQEAYEEALALRRHLAQSQPQVYTPDVAMTLNNLGTVRRNLRELALARECCEEALALRRRLAQSQPQVYTPDVAMTLNSLGNVLSDLQELALARECYEEALALSRHLAQSQPQVYTPHVAMTLNSLGVVLSYLRELALARECYEEALALRRRLAQSQPQVYTPDVAMTLNNLGNVLSDLQELALARKCYDEAIALHERHDLTLDSAVTYCNLGQLEAGAGHMERTLALFEACVERCERGLRQLMERGHRDLFKARIEPAYLWLIDYYARLAASDGQATRERLVGLLESLRRVETLAGFGAAASDRTVTWQETFHALMHDIGALAHVFRQTGCAFLWVHATSNSVVFVILTPGHCQVRVAERAVLDKLSALFHEMNHAIAAWQQSRPRAPAYEVLSLQVTTAHVPLAAVAVYHALPEDVQALLTNDNYKTIFLAPCGATVNLPWELVRVPKKRQEGNEEEWTYIGLQRLLPRIHGLGELTEVLQRHPRNEDNGTKRSGGPRTRTRGGRGTPAVVVGNPLHTGAPPLPDSRTAAQELAARLRQGGFQLLPNGEALLDAQATSDAVDAALDEPFVLWVHMGHGGWDAEGRYLYLALAGNDKLAPQPIARRRWTHHPIVDYECCVVGATLAHGGGRFDGHPTAALLAGASCVLSSVHPMFDRYAAEFSDKLYAKVLDRQNPLPFGAALLQTRQEMAQSYADSPLVWAMTVLWGNPWVQLGAGTGTGAPR